MTENEQGDRMDLVGHIEHARAEEWLTLQAALAFGGFIDTAEKGRVTVWAAEEIELLRQQLAGAASAIGELQDALTDALSGDRQRRDAARDVLAIYELAAKRGGQ